MAKYKITKDVLREFKHKNRWPSTDEDYYSVYKKFLFFWVRLDYFLTLDEARVRIDADKFKDGVTVEVVDSENL
jgi:hypothetical protein